MAKAFPLLVAGLLKNGFFAASLNNHGSLLLYLGQDGRTDSDWQKVVVLLLKRSLTLAQGCQITTTEDIIILGHMLPKINFG